MPQAQHSLREALFSTAFRSVPVYNILFEDTAVDDEILDIKPSSKVVAITGAGCGVAAMMSRRPASLDAVDINRHHLALAALKIEASRGVRRYSQFYDLLGRGWVPNAEPVLAEATGQLPRWIADYWRRRQAVFERGLYREGVTARVLGALRRLAGLDERWLRESAALSVADREAMIDRSIAPVLRSHLVRAWLQSPMQLVALGINFSQRDRLLETEAMPDLVEFVIAHLKRLAGTDVVTNWFAWYGVTGHFDHEHEEAVPPYLRRAWHGMARRSPTQVRYLHRNIFDVLRSAPSNHYTHYTLCDAPDWLDRAAQRELLQEILRTAKPGAKVLTRSVEDHSFIEKAGFDSKLTRANTLSDQATARDRSRQYRRVDVHEVTQ